MTTEIDYESIPAIAITQWEAGRVLSAEDIALIERLLKEHGDEIWDQIEMFRAAREQVLHEIGGDELVEASKKADFAMAQVSLKRAYARYEEKAAELDKHNQ
jgi:hypothetical protein